MTENKAWNVATATQDLIERLDEAPRRDWGIMSQVVLTAAFEAGHKVGYASAAKKPEKAYEPNFEARDFGEDRALNAAPSPEDKLEEDGYAYIHAIARQLATLAQRYPINPQDVVVQLFEGITPDGNLQLNVTFKKGI